MTDIQPADGIIHKLIQWAAARSSIRAILLTSTRAIPNASPDILSDYDVILIVQDIHPFVADQAWVKDFGEILVAYWDPIHPDPDFGIDIVANVIQYAGGLKIDFTLWPINLFQQITAAPALPAELDAGYQVLLDKDQLTDPLRPPSGRAFIPTQPTLTFFQTRINDFLSTAPYVAKCLWRDELLPAKWAMDYDMKHTYLRQMLEWRVEIDDGWSLPVGFLGKGLKKRLSPEVWTALEQTYAGARIAGNWEALANLMSLFRQIAVEVGDHFGYPYPHDLHQRVTAYIEWIRQLEPPAALDNA